MEGRRERYRERGRDRLKSEEILNIVSSWGVQTFIQLFNHIVLNEGSCQGNVRVFTKFDMRTFVNYEAYLITKRQLF